MKKDEVDLIYNYLHDHFEYVDGELIRKKEIHGSKSGRRLGGIKIHPEGHAYLVGAFNINGKSYNKRISHLVYLYHHKEFPKYIKYLDGNKTNTCIENLRKTRLRQYKYTPRVSMQGNTIKYRVDVEISGKSIFLGSYFSEKAAMNAYEIFVTYYDDFSITPEEAIKKSREELGLITKEKPTRTLPVGVDIERDKYRARMRLNGKRIHLGYYPTPEEAHKVYLKAKKEHALS